MHAPRTTLLQRATAALHHRRWELAPVAASSAYATLIEAHAATNPSMESPVAYGIVATIAAGATTKLVTRNQPAAYAAATGSIALAWASWQTAAGPSIAGLVVWGVATAGLGLPYWRWMAGRRDVHLKENTKVEVARYRAAAAAGRAVPAAAPAVPELAARQPLPVTPWPGITGTRSIKDPIALSPNTAISLPGRHVLVGGATDNGKSSVMHVIVAALLACPDAQIWALDMKPGAVEFGILRRAGVRVATGQADAAQMLRDLAKEGERRGNLMGATTLEEGVPTRSWTATPDEPHIVLVIDELAELADHVPQGIEMLRSATRLLRAMGITILAATQSPSAKLFGNSDARGQFDIRICLRTAEPAQTNLILGGGAHGQGWAASELLLDPGEFLIQSSRHRDVAVDRAYYMDDAAIAAHIAAHARPPQHVDAEPDPFEQAPQETPGVLADRIVLWLQDHGPAAPANIARGLGEPGGSVRPTLQTLLRKGRLAKRDDGTYTVPAARPTTGKLVALPGGRR